MDIIEIKKHISYFEKEIQSAKGRRLKQAKRILKQLQLRLQAEGRAQRF